MSDSSVRLDIMLGVFNRFFDNAPFPSFIKDKDLRYIKVSSTFVDFFHASGPDVFIGKLDSEISVQIPFFNCLNDFERQVLESDDEYYSEVLPTYVNEYNIQQYSQFTEVPYRDNEGNLVGLLGTFADYTVTYQAIQRFEHQADYYLSLPNKAYACAFIDVTDWQMLRFTKNDDGEITPIDITIEQFIGLSDRKISEDRDAHMYFANFNQSAILERFNSGIPNYKVEFAVASDEGTLWIEYEYSFIVNPANAHICIICNVIDTSSIKAEKESLIKAAELDLMTGVLNHESAMNKIRQFINNDGKGKSHALFIVDVDNFKEVNDKFGHRTGDSVICDTATKIREVFKEYDIIGRIGGDEFFILMKNIDSQYTATMKASELVHALQYECIRNGKSIYLSSSVGLTVFTGGKAKLEDLYSEADTALYQAKNTGKARFILNENADLDVVASTTNTVANMAIDLKTVLNSIDGVLFLVEMSEDGNLSVLYSSNSNYGQMTVEHMPAEDYNGIVNAIIDAHINNESIVEYTAPDARSYGGRLHWIHVKGYFLEPDKPNSYKLSFIITDVSAFKNNELALKRENTKTSLALSLSNTILWDYDITSKYILLHDKDSFPVPYYSEGMVYKDSVPEYLALYKAIDDGASDGNAFIYFKNFFGRQLWMHVSFKAVTNESGHVVGALFAATDISNFMKTMDKYDNSIRRYQQEVSENRTAFHLNLSDNLLISENIGDDISLPDFERVSSSDVLISCLESSEITAEKRDYLEVFYTSENLINYYDSGKDMIEERILLNTPSGHPEWFNIQIYLVMSPDTKDKECFVFFHNIHSEYASYSIIDRIMKFEYELLAVIDTKEQSIKILQENPASITLEGDMFDYDDLCYRTIEDKVVENERLNFAHDIDLRNVEKALEKNSVVSYSCSMYSTVDKQVIVSRKRFQFTYLDDTKRYIALTKGDVTDQYKSEFDPVSGLYNRGSFYRRAKNMILNNPRKSFVIVRWDIDRFKLYNDIFGSDAGDELLAMIGNAYREHMTDDRIVANLGADNFVMCMPNNVFDVDYEISFLTNLFASISDNYNLTFHMAGFKVEDASVDVNLMCDRALLAVKSIKDRVSVRFTWYQESMRTEFVREQQLVSDLKNALLNDEFCIYIQPQFNQMTKQMVSGEVLVRWKHADGTITSPVLFVPLMEKTGLISRLDEMVWEQTCRFLRDRKQSGKSVVPLAINISRRDFYKPNFTQIIYDLCKQYELEHELLDLEVTESAYIEDNDLICNLISELRDNGFRVKMDDFGTGYSSLNTLKHVPVDMIKLDMNFLYYDENDNDAAFRGGIILDSILRMAHWLNIPVIAEGVETAKQANFLKTINCAIVQGYYFSKPLPLDEFERLLDDVANINNSLPAFGISNSFDYCDFWNPESQSSLVFNSFVGPAGIFEICGDNFHALRLNENFYKELNLDIESFDFLSLNFLDLIVDEEIEHVKEMIAIGSDSADEITFESCFKNSTSFDISISSVVWVRLHVRRLAYSNRRSVFYISVENITARKLLEFKNEALTYRLSSIVDTIPGALFTYELSGDFRITYRNNSFASMFGFTKEELKQFDENSVQLIHPDDVDIAFRALVEEFKPNEFVRTVVVRHKCKDETYKRVTLSNTPPDKENGILSGFVLCQELADS